MRILYVLACVALILLFSGFTWLGIYDHRQEQKLASAKRSVQQVVLSYNFDSQKPEDVQQSLNALYSRIRDETNSTKAPSQAEFVHNSEEIRQSIAHLTEYSVFSKKIGVMLAGKQFGGKFVSSDEALDQAKKWQEFNDAIKNTLLTTLVQKQKDVLISSTANQVVIATKASEAYRANDAITIASQSKAANDELAKIQAVYDDVYASVRAQQSLIVGFASKL